MMSINRPAGLKFSSRWRGMPLLAALFCAINGLPGPCGAQTQNHPDAATVRSSVGDQVANSRVDDRAAATISRMNRPLRHLGWKEFERKIVQLWGNQLQATAENDDASVIRIQLPGRGDASNIMFIDRNLNQLTFEGPAQNARTWSEMVEVIDVTGTDPGHVRLVSMGRATTATVRNTISLLGIQEEHAAGLQQAIEGFAAAAAPRPPATAGREVPGTLVSSGRVVPSALAGVPAAARQDEPGRQQEPPPIVQLDDETLQGNVKIKILDEYGTIVLIGAPEDTAKVRAIIESLVQAADIAQPSVELYELKNADSVTVKPIIDDVYQSMYESQNGMINVTALATPNALLVIGRPQGQQVVAELIERLDVAAPDTAEALDFRVFRMKYMSAMDAGLKLRAYFYTGEQDNETVDSTEWIASLHGPVSIIVDYRSNSVIVKGNAEVLRRARL